MDGECMIIAEGFTYEVIEDYRDAFKEEAFWSVTVRF